MRIAVLSLITGIVFVWGAGHSALAGSAAEWNTKGNDAFVAKRYEEAVVFYSNAIQADNGCTPALYNRGLSYYRLGRLDDAWNDLTKLIEADPMSHKASNLLGLVELKQGLFDSAFGRFRRASELEEKSKYYFNAGLAAYKAGFYDVAMKYGRDALALNPKNERALKLITLCKKAEERIMEAEAEADRRVAERARAENTSRVAQTRTQCSVSRSTTRSKKVVRRVRRKG